MNRTQRIVLLFTATVASGAAFISPGPSAAANEAPPSEAASSEAASSEAASSLSGTAVPMGAGDCRTTCGACWTQTSCEDDPYCIWDDVDGNGSDECSPIASHPDVKITYPKPGVPATGCEDEHGQIQCGACLTKGDCTSNGCAWYTVETEESTVEGCGLPPDPKE